MADDNQIQIARTQIVRLLESQKAQIAMALPDQLTTDRLIRIAITTMNHNPKLYECTQVSVLASIIQAASYGFEIGVDGQAYLVPYYDNKKRQSICQLIPGWKGYVDLVSRAGRASVWTGAVRDGDDFDYQVGSDPHIHHVPSDDDTGDFTYIYACGRQNNSTFVQCEVWSRAKVKKHLAQYNKVGERHYALQNENNLEMYGRKVALMQVIKYMPKSIQMQSVQSLDLRAAEGTQHLTITDKGVIDADFEDVEPGDREKIDSATTRTEQVKAAIGARSKHNGTQQSGGSKATTEARQEPPQDHQPAQEEHQSSQQSQPETDTDGSLW